MFNRLKNSQIPSSLCSKKIKLKLITKLHYKNHRRDLFYKERRQIVVFPFMHFISNKSTIELINTPINLVQHSRSLFQYVFVLFLIYLGLVHIVTTSD